MSAAPRELKRRAELLSNALERLSSGDERSTRELFDYVPVQTANERKRASDWHRKALRSLEARGYLSIADGGHRGLPVRCRLTNAGKVLAAARMQELVEAAFGYGPAPGTETQPPPALPVTSLVAPVADARLDLLVKLLPLVLDNLVYIRERIDKDMEPKLARIHKDLAGE